MQPRADDSDMYSAASASSGGGSSRSSSDSDADARGGKAAAARRRAWRAHRRRRLVLAQLVGALAAVGTATGLARRLVGPRLAMAADGGARHHAPPLPTPLWWVTQGAALAAAAAARAWAPPPAVVAADAAGAGLTAALYAACALGLPDAVPLGVPADDVAAPVAPTTEEVAAAVGVRPASAVRLLRALAGHGYVEAVPYVTTARWRPTPLLAALRSDAPGGGLCPFVAHLVELAWEPWALLPQAVARGGGDDDGWWSAHAAAFNGSDVWARLEASPRLTAVMAAGMASVDALMGPALVTDYAWGRYTRLVDVGGSAGSFARGLLAAHPSIRCALVFDRPSVVAPAAAAWDADATACAAGAPAADARTCADVARVGGRAGVDGARARLSFAGGSFFDAATLPLLAAGDGVLLRVVLHDFTDGQCAAILRNLRAAMVSASASAAVEAAAAEQLHQQQGAGNATTPHQPQHRHGRRRLPLPPPPRLLLVEQVVEEPGGLPWPLSAAAPAGVPFRGLEDLHMLVVTGGGRERTRAQWAALLADAGFALARVVTTRSLLSVIEADVVAEEGGVAAEEGGGVGA
jgi:hypothetical protein